MTHQEITEALQEMVRDGLVALQDFRARYQRDAAPRVELLQDECGRIGHVFGSRTNLSFRPSPRICRVCGQLVNQEGAQP